jgi:plastocyanin
VASSPDLAGLLRDVEPRRSPRVEPGVRRVTRIGVVAAALVGSTPVSAAAATHSIGITGMSPATFRYDPSSLRVPAGDTVKWAASDNHPLVFDDGHGRFTSEHAEVLNTTGVVAYQCEIHAPNGMTGTVTVDAPPTIAIARETAAPRAGEPVSFRADATDPEGHAVTIDWDLDGDGTLERTNAGTTAGATFAAGEHTVRARVTDDLGAVATASHTFAVPGTGGGPASDTTAPTLTAKAPRSIRARKLRRRGVKLTLTPSEDGRLIAELRNRRGRRVGRTAAEARAGQATVIRLRARHAKGGRLKLKLKAIDLAGNRRVVTRRLEVTAR